jgi:hypothetical protein
MTAVDALAPISLEALLERAALQHRLDRKYVVAVNTVERLLEQFGDRLAVLEIDARRRFGYESWYFDTADLRLFRDHRQGRRRRWKARTRAYLDSRECLFEAKLRGSRGATIKERTPHAFDRRDELTPDAQAFLTDRLAHHYGCAPPPLQPVLATRYVRSTLVDRRHTTRITLDSDLRCEGFGRMADAPRPSVLIEVKSAASDTVFDHTLRTLGVREASLSKYCVAAAMLDPRLPANRWNRVLRRSFGWDRA